MILRTAALAALIATPALADAPKPAPAAHQVQLTDQEIATIQWLAAHLRCGPTDDVVANCEGVFPARALVIDINRQLAAPPAPTAKP